MEDFRKRTNTEAMDKEIVFSKSIKAGKRIYYLDVKKNRKEEMFISITESKKVVTGEGDEASVSFEKHKIFLYREDFNKFMEGLTETINFIDSTSADTPHSYTTPPGEETEEGFGNEKTRFFEEEIKIDIDF